MQVQYVCMFVNNKRMQNKCMISDTHYLKGFYAESQEDNFIYLFSYNFLPL